MRNTKLLTISIMPEFLEEIEKLAKEERRTKSELVREALRRYLAEKELIPFSLSNATNRSTGKAP